MRFDSTLQENEVAESLLDTFIVIQDSPNVRRCLHNFCMKNEIAMRLDRFKEVLERRLTIYGAKIIKTKDFYELIPVTELRASRELIMTYDSDLINKDWSITPFSMKGKLVRIMSEDDICNTIMNAYDKMEEDVFIDSDEWVKVSRWGSNYTDEVGSSEFLSEGWTTFPKEVIELYDYDEFKDVSYVRIKKHLTYEDDLELCPKEFRDNYKTLEGKIVKVKLTGDEMLTSIENRNIEILPFCVDGIVKFKDNSCQDDDKNDDNCQNEENEEINEVEENEVVDNLAEEVNKVEENITQSFHKKRNKRKIIGIGIIALSIISTRVR